MCLTAISSKKPEPDGEGYIVLKKHNKRLGGLFYEGRRKTGQWINEKDLRSGPGIKEDYIYVRPLRASILKSSKCKYLKGFHIIKNRGSALSYMYSLRGFFYKNICLRKVKYRKAVAIGTQSDIRGLVVVAKEMYIFPGEVKGGQLWLYDPPQISNNR